MLKCSDCGNEKVADDFPVDRSKKSGHRSCCKVCAAKRTEKWRAALSPAQIEAQRLKNVVRLRKRYYANIDESRRIGRERSQAKGFHGRKHHNLRMRFGLTLAQYNEKLKAQSGVCAICGKAETSTQFGRPRMLAVDHDHATDVIRDLLCVCCNTGIGAFREDESLLYAAIVYLLRHRA